MKMDYIKKNFSCFREISEGVYSYQVGVAKPDPRIFRIAIEQYNLEPGSTLFVDDKKGNIDSAAEYSFNARSMSPAATASSPEFILS